jgi:hypothetical protein
MGGEQCSQSLRDAFGAPLPFRWNRCGHMAAFGCVGTEERINASKKTKPQQDKALLGLSFFRSLAMTYSHMGNPHTTIGDASFHF